jgi:hypothetical protein
MLSFRCRSRLFIIADWSKTNLYFVANPAAEFFNTIGGQLSFAGARSNGETAPKAPLRATAIELATPTQSGLLGKPIRDCSGFEQTPNGSDV